MSKRDAIIISVLVNAGLLAILFVTAIRSDLELLPVDGEIEKTFVEERSASFDKDELIAALPVKPLDEIDLVLQDYIPDLSKESKTLATPEIKKGEKVAYLEVSVKKGDVLERVARAHGTTVEEIKKINQLTTDKLKIGQVLRIPTGGTKKPKNSVTTASRPKEIETEVVYYTIKRGDNPWNIAKQFRVNFDDLLRLNNLDEEKARNLKIGDRIRVN